MWYIFPTERGYNCPDKYTQTYQYKLTVEKINIYI